MPNENPRLFFEDVKYSLEKISYKTLRSVSSDKEVEMKPLDEYKVQSLDFEKIVITVTRTISFEPKSHFSLSVEAGLFLPLTQNERKFVGSLDELNNYTITHIDTIINNSSLMETISLLISQISSSYGRVPIITPPIFVGPENVKK